VASPNPSEGGALEPQRIEELLELSDKELKTKKITHILVDRIVVKSFDEDDQHRIADSIGTAFYEGEGDVYLEIQTGQQSTVHSLQKKTRSSTTHSPLTIDNSLLHFNNRFEADGMQFEEPAESFFFQQSFWCLSHL
jgi:excinuclease ABC subunit A